MKTKVLNMNEWWICVIGTFCLLPNHQVSLAEWNVNPTTENLPMERLTEKCSIWKRILDRCPKKEIKVTPTPPVSDDSSSKSLGFSFSAFVITLFTSLAIALTGAFACWCCRTFARNRSFGNSSSAGVAMTYNNEGVALESLVGDQAPVQRRNYRRHNSLPSYTNAVNVPAAIPIPSAPTEEPPPSYASLFNATVDENKSGLPPS